MNRKYWLVSLSGLVLAGCGGGGGGGSPSAPPPAPVTVPTAQALDAYRQIGHLSSFAGSDTNGNTYTYVLNDVVNPGTTVFEGTTANSTSELATVTKNGLPGVSRTFVAYYTFCLLYTSPSPRD